MLLNTVIFDMDGLLIDSEPFWQVAGTEALAKFDIALTDEQYHSTTGLRTPEWTEWWLDYFNVDRRFAPETIEWIEETALNNIRDSALGLEGVEDIFDFFKSRNFKIGLASSSPVTLIKAVAHKLNIKDRLDAFASAEGLENGKPHPEVFLNCAEELGSSPVQCLCFEDSFNGLIAAKAARMKCVVIPVSSQRGLDKWILADLQLNSLLEFNEAYLESLQKM